MSKEKLKNKGITLIALIITIIVMLILTGVTLTVTLGENGLIAKANEAKIQMQIETDREELLSAVVGAIGIDGKVDFTILDSNLPAGFTGSNGTYTSKNGNTFTVSEYGEIVYTGDGNPGVGDNVIENGGEIEFETVDLTGIYYPYFSDIGSYPYIEINNNKWITVSEDDSMELDMSMTIDETNKTVVMIVEYIEDYNTMEVLEQKMNYTYELIKENNEVVNKVLISEEGGKLIQNLNGIDFPLDGLYTSEDGEQTLEFDSEDMSCRYYHDASGITDEYGRIAGKYYFDTEQFTVSEDLNTIIYNGITFTKGSKEPTVDYTLLGSGDTITGYSPTTYTSSNPYTVSLAGCSGSFSTQNFTWEVMSVSGDTITMKANWMTTEQLSLTGANGWNNSLTALNNICLSVYGGSTSKYSATARSITFEDMGQTGSPTSSSYEASSYGSNNKFPTAYLTEYQGLTDITEDISGCGYATNSNIIVTNTSFIISSAFSANFSSPYWVNKRCVVATSTDKASFSVGWVASTGAGSPTEAILFDSSGTETTQTKSIRPVVILTIKDWSCLNTTDGGTSWTINNE